MNRSRLSGRLRAVLLGAQFAACAAAGALVAAPARAADDAGTQSVFAFGAGNRAAAMGGAFVAAVDDASAMVWNPAGLGLVPRLELQGVQSGDLGLGMSESYAAFALPSWRWGAAGMAFRYFGVSDIEQRDARNTLISSTLQDQQVELAFGYGHAFGDAWSLGGAVKMQRQSLAGYSGTGLGLDLGVDVRPAALMGLTAPWAQGLSWGLAVRNAIEPSVRLDRESVPDPLSLRGGMAWRTPTPAGGVLTEIDVSQTRGVTPRLHAGLEYRLAPAAALRVGLDDRVLTAGAGLRWGGLTLDYAFADNPIAPAHRAGVTLQFGATTDESRLAALKREDAKVERRLADAFRVRQSQQVEELLKRAADARAHGDFDGALESIALAATLEPGRNDAARLERECLSAKASGLESGSDFAGAALVWERALKLAPEDTAAAAAMTRCRAESDRRARRTTDLRARFAAAMDAFAGEDLATARTGFRQLVNLQADDAESARMLARTEQAIARRVETLSAQAMREVRAAALDAAQASLAQAQALDRDGAGVAQASLALARAREAATAATRTTAPATGAAPATAATAPQLSPRELEDLYQHGLAALRAGRSDDAVRYWELVWSARSDYREVAGYLKREYLTRGMEAFAAGRLDDATAQWERVLRVDPTDERARGYLARAQEQRARSREILGGGP